MLYIGEGGWTSHTSCTRPWLDAQALSSLFLFLLWFASRESWVCFFWRSHHSPRERNQKEGHSMEDNRVLEVLFALKKVFFIK